MRAFIAVTLTAGIIAAIVMRKQPEPAAPQPAAQKTAPAALSKAQAAAPANQPSQHWPKRALDRASDVKRQVAEQRKGDETR